MARKPQEEQVQLQLENATPDNADTASRAADPEKEQKYKAVIFPLRKGKFVGGYVKSDIIAHFNIDTNASTTASASGVTFERKAGSRAGYTGATDNSAKSETTGKTIVAKGSRSELPRGKTIKVALGKLTAKKNMRYAHIRVPSSLHAIEVAHWIKTCFRQKTPGSFQMGRTRYTVEALAAAIGQLPERKSSQQQQG